MEKALKVEGAMSTGIVDAMNRAVAGPSTDDASTGDDNIKYTLADLQTQFDTLNRQLERKQKDVRKARFTLGDAVGKLNPGGDTDALLFTRIFDRELTGGKMAMTIIMMGGAAPVFLVKIAVVDAHTGTVLYSGKAAGREKDGPTKLVKTILKKFPCSASPTPQSASSSATHP